MRLLIALPDPELARLVASEMENRLWHVEVVTDGRPLLTREEGDDLWLVHDCLPGLDGRSAGDALQARRLICPPRVLFLCPREFAADRPAWADCMVTPGVTVKRLCALLRTLAQKPLPNLAAACEWEVAQAVAAFLDEIGLDRALKGRACAEWLLRRMVPSPLCEAQPIKALYADCSAAMGVSAPSVERSLRVAVESVFMRGSMRGIERFFGATVDPERGKPTNRAFLLQASQQLRLELNRYSRTPSRSPNSSEMHHSPAAPTSV